jgi:alkanesulfonate monooxygenase SsuD/methylene tetrahydromethanopterin reductase-like flavin-dependent oxidoreductase (luciferase family)
MSERRAMYTPNALKLGLFCANASNARQMTLVPERWSGTWADNVALAAMSEAAGLEFLLPIARWKGYGGVTNHQASTFETLTWATALLALTERITIFATVHVPLMNAVAAAKALVTADHVSGGRIGLNIVVGWNEDEFEMFGVPQRPVDERYPYAQEWIDVVQRVWSEAEPFDVAGTFLQMRGVEGNPKPLGGARPLMMNAGRSPAGRAYAIRNCDAFFTDTSRTSLEETAAQIAAFKATARAQNRDLDLYADGLIVCRPTAREAEEYYRYALVDNLDLAAIEGKLARHGITRETRPGENFDEICRKNAGIGRAFVGDPDAIADQLAGLAHAGLRGMALNFINFLGELPYFRDEVLPRLERLGLRERGVLS